MGACCRACLHAGVDASLRACTVCMCGARRTACGRCAARVWRRLAGCGAQGQCVAMCRRRAKGCLAGGAGRGTGARSAAGARRRRACLRRWRGRQACRAPAAAGRQIARDAQITSGGGGAAAGRQAACRFSPADARCMHYRRCRERAWRSGGTGAVRCRAGGCASGARVRKRCVLAPPASTSFGPCGGCLDLIAQGQCRAHPSSDDQWPCV